MDSRNIKLALARQMLKNHQEKKVKPDAIDVINSTDVPIIQSSNTNIADPTKHNSEDTLAAPVEHNINNDKVIPEPKEYSMNVTMKSEDIVRERELENEIVSLKLKILHLEDSHNSTLKDLNDIKQINSQLQNELFTLKNKNETISSESLHKNKNINELLSKLKYLTEENNNYVEQAELTKNILSSKDNENIILRNQLIKIQQQLEANELRLQQLTNGASNVNCKQAETVSDNNEQLLQKISFLEHQLKTAQKERIQINTHYEQYVAELNEEVKSALKKNEILLKENHDLSSKESGLIEQIGFMEIQLQKLRNVDHTIETPNSVCKDERENVGEELLNKYEKLQEHMQQLQKENEHLKHNLSIAKTEIQTMKSQPVNNDICITKLHNDIENDKIAAQRATEQNKKLKVDLQNLEDAFVKMSKDKLELTEKLQAEKFLNRELTIKLSEHVEKSKEVETKLNAKDEEMIRLLTNYRQLEKSLEAHEAESDKQSDIINDAHSDEACLDPVVIEYNDHDHDNDNKSSYHTSEHVHSHSCDQENHLVRKHDAMNKLQQRFLKIMDEVANLSDEKHRLEHIITQLQNETDTICEYVALYQQQRSLLKHRDEERSAQIKIFQSECDSMRTQLNQLSERFIKLVEDKELVMYYKQGSRHQDVSDILSLIQNMKDNFLVNVDKCSKEMKNFYPCACCSGNVIDL